MLKKLTIWCLLIFIVGCKKDDNPVPNRYSGTASALKNGEEWGSLTYFEELKAEPSLFILRANVYNDKGFWRETFNIRRIQANMDRQEITSLDSKNNFGFLSSGYGTLIYDGDVASDIYSLDTTAINNFIQITSYSSEKAEIEGVFNVSFVLTREGNGPGTPAQNLEFTNGKFTSKVEPGWFE